MSKIKIVLLGLVLTLFVVVLYLLINAKESITVDLAQNGEIRKLNNFLYLNNKSLVLLDIKFDKDMDTNVTKELQNSPILLIKSGKKFRDKNIFYRVNSSELKSKEFLYQDGELEGLFKVFVEEGRDTIVMDLVPQTP